MTDDPKTVRCTMCRTEFTDVEVEGANACPVCHRPQLPMRIADDVTVAVNWHEIRILGMWAENWAIKANDESMVRSVRIITSLIQQQHPDKPPLTLSGEMREWRHQAQEMGGSLQLSDPRLYIPDEESLGGRS